MKPKDQIREEDGLIKIEKDSKLRFESNIGISEVVGSTPTLSIFSCYRITALNYVCFGKMSDKTHWQQ